jgi:Uma2 family endonuclease
MVTALIKPDDASQGDRSRLPQTLEEFIAYPVNQAEWVDGEIVEKTGMTVEHGVVQINLGAAWKAFAQARGLGGAACTDAPCRTTKQVRRPDVAFITQAMLEQEGKPATMPYSFPLVAEIASPTDFAEELFSKAQEYLESGSEEVWMVFPENQWVLVLTKTQHLWYTNGEVIQSQVVLPGFAIAIKDLLT